MTKEKLIEWLNKQPEDIQVFMTAKDQYDCVTIKVFIKPKEQSLLDWYFAP